MSLNIPNTELPGNSFLKGIDTGSSMFSRLMNPVIQRENMMRQWKQHLENMALQKQQMAHAGRNDDLQRQILQERYTGLKNSNDPNYEINKFKSAVGNLNDVDMEALKKNPALRGFFKHQFGYDPLEPTPQTPEEKQSAALDLFKQKEAIKQSNKSGDMATNKVLTQNQQAVQAIDTVMPMIDEFIEHPNTVYGLSDFSPSKKAAYEAKTGGMIDMLVAAQSLPQVKESIKLVADQIRRRTNETTDSYIKRLKDFKKDLAARYSKAISVVQSKRVNTQGSGNDFSQMSDDELRKIAEEG